MISQEDMAILSEFETTFDAAVNKGYGRNLGMKLYRQLNDIYEHIKGERYQGKGWGCPSCNFEFVTIMAKMYFDEKKRIEDEKHLKEQLEPKPEPKPKKSPGRPKSSK